MALHPGLGQCGATDRAVRLGHRTAGQTKDSAAGRDNAYALGRECPGSGGGSAMAHSGWITEAHYNARRLLSLLQPAEDGNRYSLLDRLRRAPTRISAAGMLDALDRLWVPRPGVEDLDLAQVPPGRLRTLARYAAL